MLYNSTYSLVGALEKRLMHELFSLLLPELNFGYSLKSDSSSYNLSGTRLALCYPSNDELSMWSYKTYFNVLSSFSING